MKQNIVRIAVCAVALAFAGFSQLFSQQQTGQQTNQQAAPAQNSGQQNQQAQDGQGGQSSDQQSREGKVNLILETFSMVNDNDVQLKTLINSYLNSDNVNPEVLSAELINAFAGIDPRKVVPPKKTIFNTVLSNLLDQAIENNSSLTGEVLGSAATKLLNQENDVIILMKAITLYGGIAEGADDDKKYAFARDTLYMLRRLQAKTDRYTLATLIETAGPILAKTMNKKIATDQELMGIVMLLYSRTVVPNAEKALQTLYASAVEAAIS